jgi:hypothetical protein
MSPKHHNSRISPNKSINQKTGISFGVLDLVSLSAFFLAFALLISSYFGKNILSLFIFSANDGWCLNNAVGVGSHCFGDFGAPLNFAGEGIDHFYSSGVTALYPPLNYYIFAFFHYLAVNFSYSTSLYIYLMVTSFGFLITFSAALKHLILNKLRIIIYSLGLISLLPIIMTLDRGNIVGFALPILYLYIYSKKNTKKWKRILLSCMLINLKPQFVLLLIWKIKKGEWKEFAEEIIAASFSYAFLFFIGSPRNLVHNIQIFVNSILNYSKIDFNVQYPYNYSFAQGIHNLSSAIFGINLTPGLAAELGVFFSGLVLLGIIVSKNYLSSSTFLTLLLPILFLIPNLSYPYYSLVLLPLLITEENVFTLRFPHLKADKLLKSLFIFCVLITVLPIYLGNDMLGIAKNPYNSIQIFLPCAWVLTYTVVIVEALAHGYRALNVSLKGGKFSQPR